MRAKRDEPLVLDPPAALQRLLRRRLQVVVPDRRECPAIPVQRMHVPLEERLLALGLERHHEARTREARPHQEQAAPSPAPRRSTPSPRPSRPPRSHPDRAPADRTPPPPTPTPAAGDAHNSRTVVSPTTAPCSSTSRSCIRFAVCRCLRGASRSAKSHESISSRYAPNAGAGRPAGRLRSGGTADPSACRTARLCTPCRRANACTDSPSNSRSLRILSNSSTLEPIPSATSDPCSEKHGP